MITLTVLAVGQMLTLLYDPADLQLFIIASILVSLSAVPVALSTATTPDQSNKGSIDLRRLFKISPSGALGCLVSGLANGSFWAMAPVFTSSVSSGTTLAAWFMTSAVIGGALSQWPLGLLSDRFSRRGVLAMITAGGCVVGITMSYMAPELTFLGANILAAIWGALAFPLYTIAVAYTNDRAETYEYVTVSSGLLLLYGIGAILGPLIASAWITLRNPGELFIFSAFAHALLAIYVVTRWLRRLRAAPDHPISFSDALAATQTVSHVYEEELQDDRPQGS
jgi:MFS family permease